jgi:hypothetical protein
MGYTTLQSHLSRLRASPYVRRYVPLARDCCYIVHRHCWNAPPGDADIISLKSVTWDDPLIERSIVLREESF